MATSLQQTVDRLGAAVPVAPPRPAFLQAVELRLLLFGGKGGVGKTTCAAAAALHFARRSPDQKYLIVSTDPAHSLHDVLGEAALPPNLEVREIDASGSLECFKEAHNHHLEQIALRGTLLDQEDVAELLKLSLPGLDEIMAFREIAGLVQSRTHACVVVDTAPTGHTLRLLALPETLRNWLAALDAMLAKHRCMVRLYRGSYSKEDVDLFLEDLAGTVEQLAALLGDRQQCCFVPVTLAEPVISAETVRLVEQLANMDVPVQELLVNCLNESGSDCRACEAERRQQEEELARLAARLPWYPLWRIARQGAEVRGLGQLASFWDEVRPVEPVEARPLPAARAKPGLDYPLKKGTGSAPPGLGVGQADAPSGASTLAERTPAARASARATAEPPRVENPPKLPPPGTALVLFAGKGGVGKTTLASATALRLAQAYPRRKVLLVSTDPAHSLSDVLDTPVGSRGVELGPGLTALESNADEEFAALRQRYAAEVEEFFDSLTGGTMVDITFDREVIERLMDLSPPGLDEMMALTRVISLLETGRHDLLVCDTAPTGHLLRLLELPALVQDWLRVFFSLLLKYKHVFRLPTLSQRLVTLSKQIKLVRSLLTNPQKTRLYAVALPTEMALEETRDLLTACRRLAIHVPALFLNQVRPAGACGFCQHVAAAESAVLDRFRQLLPDVPQATVRRCELPCGLDRLRALGAELYQG